MIKAGETVDALEMFKDIPIEMGENFEIRIEKGDALSASLFYTEKSGFGG